MNTCIICFNKFEESKSPFTNFCSISCIREWKKEITKWQ